MDRIRCKKILFIIFMFLLLSGCTDSGKNIKLDPKNPITVSVWHYYNGSQLKAFENLIDQFNETVGQEQGIIVEQLAHGSVGELEKCVLSSAKKEIGSLKMPSIFASYADTAYEAEKLGLLANLDDYFTEEEQAQYLSSYIEEGRIGLNGELRIFPIAKSTETLFLNRTDWDNFAEANALTYDDLLTMESITKISELYYNWTDGLTPDISNDGKAFFGRDSMANLFITGSKEFGIEIFSVDSGIATINLNEEVMRKIWDNYYVPFISGYFYSYGRFRSDDAMVGDILAYVGSTTSASYFPKEVTTGSESYSITAEILPVPMLGGNERVLVQQGAGMVVTKGETLNEYASVVFLKWFTDTQKNAEFALLSGYMPVKQEANNFEFIESVMDNIEMVTLNPILKDTLRISINEVNTNKLYTNKAFTGGAKAREILSNNLKDKADMDRKTVLEYLSKGISLKEAVAEFDSNENFEIWLKELEYELINAAK